MEKKALFENVAGSDRPASFEPFTLMAALSQVTEHIGLFVTATTTYDEPYLMARRFASLDHLSDGRAVWNVVTGSYSGDALNFGDDDLPDRHVRYERSIEFLDVCKGLWDSWADDAFPQDKASGKFLDSTRVHTLNHEGKHFNVKGPLNVARSPQGYPIICMAGQSDPGREMAAKHADCLLITASDMNESIEVYNDVKSRLAKYGRDPRDLKIVTGVKANVAETHQQAVDFYKELNKLIAPELAVQYLSSEVKEDLSGYPIDGPLPDLSSEVQGVTSIRKSIYEHAVAHNYTIRQTYEHLLASEDEPPFTGTAAEVVDELQEWFEAGACDGFMVSGPTVPYSLESFVTLAVPELQRRGLHRQEYEPGTLREQWGLPTPRNPYFA
jgi:FMN-dependent oxidoreductase (nitrilotriacetate monooxygenase family)